MPSRVSRVLDTHGSLVFPGVYDPVSAKIAEQAGFPLAFISGYAVAATLLGEPDLGLLTQTEIVERARHICRSVNIPILVDADTGYGNALNVVRTVTELIDAGAAGCFLEDQQWPKRCGHLQGKRVVDRQEYLEKIGAAVEARADHDFFIVARTDALAAVGLDEALDRVEAARAAGADATFVEAPGSLEELAEVGRRAPKPTVANMVEHGRTPVLPHAQLAEMGFNLVLYPVTGLYASAHALTAAYGHLHAQGTSTGSGDRLMAFDEFNALVGVDEKYALAQKWSTRSK
ncbi:MAG: isocitrate lyase/phosphoenolpyruvate mutase family protein [Vicinamibacterales bacterium]|nr:isocitrate lyase/phosphoenolpyruvate mutase family protein [Vicinamibacterales bacterium]